MQAQELAELHKSNEAITGEYQKLQVNYRSQGDELSAVQEQLLELKEKEEQYIMEFQRKQDLQYEYREEREESMKSKESCFEK